MTAEIDPQAVEYVLGTLPSDERVTFEHRLATDAEARQGVSALQSRLAPLSMAISDVAPSPALWGKIEAAVQSAGRAPARTLDLAAEAARLNRARNLWRYSTCVVSAIAACLALFIVSHDILREASPPSSYIAVVNRGGDQPALIVRVDLASKSVFIRPVAAEVPPGQSLELWYIGKGAAPKSMGLVDKTPSERVLPQDALLEKANFAVTVEPVGGSPTGGPTGPIVYSGQLIRE